MTKHTPGPWTFKPTGCFIDAEGKPMTRPTEFSIAPIHGVLLTAGNVDRAEANARLIAAAPEMLAALQEILSIEATSPEGGHEAVAEIHHTARAAITKATQE